MVTTFQLNCQPFSSVCDALEMHLKKADNSAEIWRPLVCSYHLTALFDLIHFNNIHCEHLHGYKSGPVTKSIEYLALKVWKIM